MNVNNNAYESETNQDELIMAQKNAIDREIADSSSMIGPRQPISWLLPPGELNKSYIDKIEYLQMHYSSIRKVRPDGNCFFRGFIFSYFESLINDKQEYNRFYNVIKQSKDDLLKLGFDKFTLEDFYQNMMEVLCELKEARTVSHVERIVTDQSVADYIVVYMRILTSGYMQKHADFYVNFIEGFSSVKEFCMHEVEPMFRESDHIHITCLTAALGIGIRIVYLDRGGAIARNTNQNALSTGSQPVARSCNTSDTVIGQSTAASTPPVTSHQFLPDDVAKTRVTLLYCPGHYDILYEITRS